jgi:uncharacterized protein YjbI with pentapeptide repeats
VTLDELDFSDRSFRPLRVEAQAVRATKIHRRNLQGLHLRAGTLCNCNFTEARMDNCLFYFAQRKKAGCTFAFCEMKSLELEI